MNLCRLCGEQKSPLDFNVELNDTTSSNWSYRDLIEYHTRVSLNSNKLLPQGICEDCQGQVEKFVLFSSIVQNSQLKFDYEESQYAISEIENYQIDQMFQEFLPENPRKRRKQSFNNIKVEQPVNQDNLEEITVKVEPDEASRIEFGDFIFDIKEVPDKGSKLNISNKRSREEKEEIEDPRKPTFEVMFKDEFAGTSKHPHLHLNVPGDCTLPNGEVPEEFAQKVSTLRWKDILKCLICKDLGFENVLDMKNHQAQHHEKGARVFGCPICKEGTVFSSFKSGFVNENALYNHLVERHWLDHLKFCCMICSKMFYDLKSIYKHYKTHKGGFYPNVCLICGLALMTSMKKHIEEKHVSMKKTESQYFCERIQAKFDQRIVENPTNSFVEDHEKNADGTVTEECQKRLEVDWSFGNFDCAKCNLQLKTPFEFYCHLARFHPKTMWQKDHVEKVELNIKKPYACKLCEGAKIKHTFDQLQSFINHAIDERHRNNIDFSCVICQTVFWNLRALVIHYKEVHPSFACYCCNHCGKIFESPSYTAYHYNMEVADESEKMLKPQNEEFFCDQCPHKTNTKSALKAHSERIHKIVKPEDMLKCEHCEKLFKLEAALKQHMFVHSTKKMYKCDQCNHAATSRDVLMRHIGRMHKKERTKQCIECGKAFFTTFELQMHLRFKHTGERPFVCNEGCDDVAYFTRDRLVKHMSQVHGKDIRNEDYVRRTEANKRLFGTAENSSSDTETE